ncbi:ribonuclease P protein component [Sinomonas cyclohexanicum]|uniref:Ribonuclease P protein component n=1 Tax=Sinomonas cyclohexanicum TaxID=322009 RepID=A0ABN6FNR8_SINCY|nr:ribonuclease P protein component [Corynebacterium cyclohexanicum]BCT78326.1 ribonuclease P protein component [Corynebacterium cyclohexanicum]
MLATTHRLRSAADFTHTVRSGVRQGRRNVVLYAVRSEGRPSRFGFIVSKAVGNAVTRNLVKRRLREAAASTVRAQPEGLDVVVRALPASAQASWADLSKDYESALGGALRRLDRDAQPGGLPSGGERSAHGGHG